MTVNIGIDGGVRPGRSLRTRGDQMERTSNRERQNPVVRIAIGPNSFRCVRTTVRSVTVIECFIDKEGNQLTTIDARLIQI